MWTARTPLRDRYYHNLRVFYWISVNFTVIKISNTAWTARSFPLSIPKIPHNKTETKHCEYTQIRGCVLLPLGPCGRALRNNPVQFEFSGRGVWGGGGVVGEVLAVAVQRWRRVHIYIYISREEDEAYTPDNVRTVCKG